MAKTTIKKHSATRSEKPLLSILVPVYNEEATIQQILQKVTALPIENYEVLVVDDASTDRSRAIIETFAKAFDRPELTFQLLAHERNRGKGAGIKTGLRHARGKYFIIQDADLEYDPADIPPLLNEAVAEDRAVVYGSRFLGTIRNMPIANLYANRFYNFLLRRLYRTTITDMHTCYKMAKTDLLKEFNMSSEGFGYATELVSKILRRGIRIHEAPISFSGRTKKDGKKIGVHDGFDCVYMILKYRFAKEL
jgi:glycosyltransferase involved in cell wall biosynthesis